MRDAKSEKDDMYKGVKGDMRGEWRYIQGQQKAYLVGPMQS